MAKGHAVAVALTALWTAAPAFTGVKVVDGPQATYDASPEWLFVGYDGGEPDGKTPGIQTAQDWMSFARTLQEPVAAVTCGLTVKGGGPDLLTARARVYTLLTAASDVVRADPTLGGLVMQSYVSESRYYPLIGSGGSKARLVFDVAYRAQL